MSFVNLTKAQMKTFQFIEGYMTEYGLAPTTQEIADGIQIRSRGVVHRYLKALHDQGLIELLPQKKRNIRLIKQRAANQELPLIGKIAAGLPIEALPGDETLNVPNLFLGPNRYALKVQGDSMIDEGIWDGDIVVCEHVQQAPNGAIVVALIDHEAATLKRIYFQKDQTVTLVPANATHQPQTYSADRVMIQGIFIGLIRISGGKL